MIAYAVQASRAEDRSDFLRFCRPGLDRVMGEDDQVRLLAGSSIHQGYNLAIDWARTLEDLEALVLLHADAEILDEAFPRRLRNLLKRDPMAAVVGVAGATTCRDLLWWDEPRQLGGCFHEEGTPYAFHTEGDREAAVVDGVLLALSPWAVGALNFDELAYAESPWYAYDCDVSLAAMAAGKKVFVLDTWLRHHTKGGIHDVPAFVKASLAFTKKWAGSGLLGKEVS